MSRFVWTLVWRESRGAFRHFLFFLTCIALGVGALVGVVSLAANLRDTIGQEARSLLAADLEIRLQRPLSEKGEAILESLRNRGVRLAQISELVAMATDLQGRETQLVELKAVAPGYPFYGRLRTAPDLPLSQLLSSQGALVQEALLIRLDLRVGDKIRVGQTELRIAGIIQKEPDRAAGVFSLGPRLLISREALSATALIQPGSRVRHRYLLQVPTGIDLRTLQEELTSSLKGEGVQVTTYLATHPQLRRFFIRLTTYLGLVGLIALLVGGVGVANSVRVFLKERVDTIAILKSLGASSRTVLQVYLIQILFMGLLGSLIGLVLGGAVQVCLQTLLARFVPVEVRFRVTPLPAIEGVALGLLSALLFSVKPLLSVRAVPPALIFRREVEGSSPQPDGKIPWAVMLVIGGGLVALCFYQAGSFTVGGIFLGALVVAVSLLWVTAWTILRCLKKVPPPRSLIWRYAMANLNRPGSQAVSIVISMGVGVMVVLAAYLVEMTLLQQVQERLPRDAPTFFFIDIQPDQAGPFRHLMETRGHPDVELVPLVRSHLHALNGVEVADLVQEEGRRSWALEREYVLTFQERLPRDNTVIRGEWWGPGRQHNGALISVEEEIARTLGVDLGSTILFDIQGMRVPAVVASIRQVQWENMSTNFFIIFSPGSLDGVPTTYVATVRTRPEEDAELQRAVVRALPNVTAIHLRDVLETVGGVLERISLAIRFVGTFTVLAGLVVLSGAIAATQYQRVREMVILKTLGATRRVLVGTFTVEYALLGALAGLAGVLLASLLSWILLRFVMDSPWSFQGSALCVGFLVTLFLVFLVGFLTSIRLMGQKPLAVLRHE